MAIEELRLHRDWIPVIARWHFDQWGPLTGAQTFERYIGVLQECAEGSDVPSVLVAVLDGNVLGSASLVACDLSPRPSLTPWLAQVFVLSDYRHQGIGAALVRAAAARARNLGFPRLYLYTSGDLPRCYERLGWTIEEHVEYLGRRRAVMHNALYNCFLHPKL
jgi:GNAT superfamily N-acetyltransferase